MPGEVRINGRFRVDKRIGSGSWGVCYSATNVETGETVACKLESLKTKQPMLASEHKLYTRIEASGGGEAVPTVHWYGVDGEFNVLVMDLLGKSLMGCFELCKYKFSLKTVCMIAEQMISCIEFVHKNHYVYRDVKPENFVMGLGNKANRVHVIDFGLSKKYRHPETLKHISYAENKRMCGTVKYVSVRTQKGAEQGRRDDLESIGYVLVYFLKGTLPWSNLRMKGKEGDTVTPVDRVLQSKMSTKLHELCKGCPKEMITYLEYCRGLAFEAEPDYEYLRQLWRDVMTREGFEQDGIFDWMPLLNAKQEDSSNVQTSIENQSTCDNSDDNSPSSRSKEYTPTSLCRTPTSICTGGEPLPDVN
eukprot:gnl/TRDRNA2_/TRDRNA2_160198_c0_seq1.p1 gnl/TRDRNA2_/TRDRNA2_160198_c0~~gnl/TRDRNA2_/TRDRNA2_160198_c0_seq1.p1  ORF type:complete len:402 (-),score=58.40 gnl/TRDRNA2_/TRDRNA2_160198_c0_seq1:139-1224(-)